jgi:hypothetical protein
MTAAVKKVKKIGDYTMTLELTRLLPMERDRATAKKLGGFREVLDEVNQLLALAGDHYGRLQLHDRLTAQCVIIRAVLEDSNDGGYHRTLFSFARALTILCDFAAKGLGAITLNATERSVSATLMPKLTEGSSAGIWVGTLEAWLKTAHFIRTYRDDLLGDVDLENLLRRDIAIREALPGEPVPEAIVDEVVEHPSFSSTIAVRGGGDEPQSCGERRDRRQCDRLRSWRSRSSPQAIECHPVPCGDLTVGVG